MNEATAFGLSSKSLGVTVSVRIGSENRVRFAPMLVKHNMAVFTKGTPIYLFGSGYQRKESPLALSL